MTGKSLNRAPQLRFTCRNSEGYRGLPPVSESRSPFVPALEPVVWLLLGLGCPGGCAEAPGLSCSPTNPDSPESRVLMPLSASSCICLLDCICCWPGVVDC